MAINDCFVIRSFPSPMIRMMMILYFDVAAARLLIVAIPTQQQREAVLGALFTDRENVVHICRYI